MNERRATKRALLTSITALVMCVVMLAGTTFAWFTDTASTNVNKIQAGKLDVKLEMATGWDADGNPTAWDDAEGKTLNFLQKQANGTVAANADILWEPGCTYELPELKVVNNGNLALKYEIAITGAVDADGRNDLDSMKLLNVLKFKSVVNNVPMENAYGQTIATGKLETNGEGQTIQLSAKMDENAGNGYMNMALSNITVTVKAMQASYEYDSNGNTYDENADMTPDNLDKRISANVTIPVAATGATVLKNADGTVELTAPAGSIDNAKSLTLKVEPKTAAENNFTVNAGQTAQPYEISLVDENSIKVTAKDSMLFTVKLYVGKGLNNVKVYHNDTVIAATYDNDGYVTFTTNSFSPFTVVFDTPVAIVGDTYYNTLPDAVAAAKDGDTITLLKDSTENGVKVEKKGFVLDLNGHTLKIGNPLVGSTGTETNGFQLMSSAGNVTFKNGTLTTEEAYILIQNYCNLTLDNMVLDGRNIPLHAKYPNRVVRYTLSNNCGNVTINNSVIYAPEKLGVAFDVCRYSEYPAVSVTVNGDSVINGNVEVSGTIGEGQSRQLTINSGMFNGKFKVSNTPANITITGGTFTADPSGYLAEGYEATESNGVWTVTKSN